MKDNSNIIRVITDSVENINKLEKQKTTISESISKTLTDHIYSQIKFKDNNIHGLYVLLTKSVANGNKDHLKLFTDLLNAKVFSLAVGETISALKLREIFNALENNDIVKVIEGENTGFTIDFIEHPHILSKYVSGLASDENIIQFQISFRKVDSGYQLSEFNSLHGVVEYE